ncbi:hypothetical protein SEA_ATUIN_313 [Arthrobacter phage Atuin]|nr:hypothetical protein SEA_ATUIN_112 [Arthrobacter phage Atuin]
MFLTNQQPSEEDTVINKFTHTENKHMVEVLTLQAIELGMLAPDCRLVYGKGNTSYGHATEIYAERIEEDGQRRRMSRPQWVPEFGYKDGPSFVGNQIAAVQNALYGMIGVKQNEARKQLAAQDDSTNRYRRAELENVDASGEYPAKVKFFSDAGDSKHLNITATEFEQMKAVLLDYRND